MSWMDCVLTFLVIMRFRAKTCYLHFAALDHFIEGFPTYAGILKEIKREFEAALNRVVVFARDNVQLRQQRTADKAARGEAVDKAYKKVLNHSLYYSHLRWSIELKSTISCSNSAAVVTCLSLAIILIPFGIVLVFHCAMVMARALLWQRKGLGPWR